MRVSTAVRTAMVDAGADQYDAGAGVSKLQLRTGAAPANLTDPAAGVLLAEFDLPDPLFAAGVGGSAAANAITTVQGVAAGNVGHFRVLDGNAAVVEDSNQVGVTGSGEELELNTITISVGVDVDVTSWTITQPAGAP